MFLGKKKSIYWEKEKVSLLESLDEILPFVQEQNELMNIPSIKSIKRIYSVFTEYLIEFGFKVYGGAAIDRSLRLASDNKVYSYKKPYLKDIEFYSSDPKNEAIKLVDYLMSSDKITEKEKENIIALDARHIDTYKISVDFNLYCDISYVPDWILNQIPRIECPDGLICVHPSFIIIDYLRILNNKQAAFKWENTVNRLYLMQQYYPFNLTYEPIESLTIQAHIKKILKNKNIQKNLINSIINEFWEIDMSIPKECVATGFCSYNFTYNYAVINNSEIKEKLYNSKFKITAIEIPYVEILSVNYQSSCNKIENFIKSKLVEDQYSKITKEKYYPFFQFFNEITVYYYDDYPISCIYNFDGSSLPCITLVRKPIVYSSFLYTLMFFNICKFKTNFNKKASDVVGKINKLFDRNLYSYLISNLLFMRKVYLKHNKLNPVNRQSVFSDIILNSIGISLDFIRDSDLRWKISKKKWRYVPKIGVKGPTLSKNYSNLSGNLIVKNKKKSKINEKEKKLEKKESKSGTFNKSNKSSDEESDKSDESDESDESEQSESNNSN